MVKSSKVISTKTLAPVRGGSGHMFGQQKAGNRSSGVTGKKDSGGGGKFGKGGSGHMIGKQQASARRSGVTGK